MKKAPLSTVLFTSLALTFALPSPSFGDKELKKDAKEVGAGVKGAAKGVGHAAKNIWLKTKRVFKGTKESIKKEVKN